MDRIVKQVRFHNSREMLIEMGTAMDNSHVYLHMAKVHEIWTSMVGKN